MRLSNQHRHASEASAAAESLQASERRNGDRQIASRLGKKAECKTQTCGLIESQGERRCN